MKFLKNIQKIKKIKLQNIQNLFIKKITDALNNFSYNVIIANVHEFYTFLSKEINKFIQKKL